MGTWKLHIIHYKNIKSPIDFTELIFLDSGGYECSKDSEFAELGYLPYDSKEWNISYYKKVLESWKNDTPTVLISYDHPKERCSIPEQVDRAKELFKGRKDAIIEMLIKPETQYQKYVQVDEVLRNAHALSDFGIIGFTEKELGKNLLDRMVNIARIRTKLTKCGINCPIHIFGSLDTISTPLYYLAGADIFDGLTWLRFAYMNGQTAYIQSYVALELGIKIRDDMAPAQIWWRNYNYLTDLELQMRTYLNAREFKSFKYHSGFLENSFQSMKAELEGD